MNVLAAAVGEDLVQAHRGTDADLLAFGFPKRPGIRRRPPNGEDVDAAVELCGKERAPDGEKHKQRQGRWVQGFVCTVGQGAVVLEQRAGSGANTIRFARG